MSTPWFTDALGTLYVLVGLVTTGLIAPWGLRGVRLWLLANRPHSTIGWIFAPFWVLVVIALGLAALYILVSIWPIVAIVVVQRRARAGRIDEALDAEDEEELLREARRVRRERAEGLGGDEDAV